MNKTYCFRVYLGYDEHLAYISTESRKEAEKELVDEYWPDVIDYKFLGTE